MELVLLSSVLLAIVGFFFVQLTMPKIKGNVDNSGKKIYHLPEDRLYKSVVIDESRGEKYFKTEEQAQKEGFVRSKVR